MSDWWVVLKEGRKEVQCPKCKRMFYGENALQNHHCVPNAPVNPRTGDVDYRQPLSPNENKDMYDFLNQFGLNVTQGDANCPACQGKGTIDEGDPCPICRGG